MLRLVGEGRHFIVVQRGKDAAYLEVEEDSAFYAIKTFFTFLILLSALIPISLIVSVEMVKVVHMLAINVDKEMYYAPLDKYVGPAGDSCAMRVCLGGVCVAAQACEGAHQYAQRRARPSVTCLLGQDGHADAEPHGLHEVHHCGQELRHRYSRGCEECHAARAGACVPLFAAFAPLSLAPRNALSLVV